VKACNRLYVIVGYVNLVILKYGFFVNRIQVLQK